MYLYFLSAFIFLQGFAQETNRFKISSNAESNQLIHFSNKNGTFWVGETNGETRHFLMGLISYRERFFSDYSFSIDGKKAERETVSGVDYYPWKAVRTYKNDVKEQIFIPDYQDAMLIEFEASATKNVQFNLFGDGFEEIVALDTSKTPNSILIRTDKKVNPYLTLSSNLKIRSAELDLGDLKIQLSPEKMSSNKQLITFAIGLGRDENEAKNESDSILLHKDEWISKKRDRIISLTESIGFESKNSEINKAFLWALASFDALLMDENKTELGKGIYAGYPWFQDYWGRDSFIALRALTATGQFELAKANLLSFLKYQVQDSSNPDYGKIPNRVRPDESIYNTADATPRFIIEAWNYALYSGDESFLDEVLPYINHAIKGTIKYRTDGFGFLVHGDADTWMDAVGPKGAYSPRGNKANDIQALWIQALEASRNMASKRAEFTELARLSDAFYQKVNAAFRGKFINAHYSGPVVFDAIDAEGKPSNQLRINEIFTLPIIDDAPTKSRVFKQVVSQLGTRFGAMTLSKNDEWFHPFHKMELLYEQDAAYHNGIIWLWNTGALVKAFFQYGYENFAFEIIRNYSHRILNDVSLGTLPELYDAVPRTAAWSQKYPDDKEFRTISRFDQLTLRETKSLLKHDAPVASGTFSQAWSLSEYIRMFTDYLIGSDYDGTYFIMRPRAMKGLEQYSLNCYIHQAKIRMDVSQTEVHLFVENSGDSINMLVGVPGSPDAMEVLIPKGESDFIISVFEQIGQIAGEKEYVLNRKANFFSIDEAVKSETRKISWPDFSRVGQFQEIYQTQMDKK